MTPEQAKTIAVACLAAQGVSREWAETHLGAVRYDASSNALYIEYFLDTPIKRLTGTFTIDASIPEEPTE